MLLDLRAIFLRTIKQQYNVLGTCKLFMLILHFVFNVKIKKDLKEKIAILVDHKTILELQEKIGITKSFDVINWTHTFKLCNKKVCKIYVNLWL